ncbi:hypothetical protein [Massilibacteroides sp.]|uniref:hypothetical protein n=1 Tax=Massilibacteroides sp. TaxID=2034766 RepID=UPI00262E87FF|nr:hypothetical protein [Massilibacteroides sp.]MDD4516341.1 hypothetical protein [Massilibacteroides sp.]
MILPTPSKDNCLKIYRGTSVSLPVKIRVSAKIPFDLTGYEGFITVKSAMWDHDYYDSRAAIKKNLVFENPASGEFEIKLSPKETWIEPGEYYFDIQLKKDNAIAHLVFFKLEIIGLPTNRTATELTEPPTGEAIVENGNLEIILPEKSSPIIIYTPLISKTPTNLVETITAEPAYLLEGLDDPDEPQRNFKIKSYGAQVAFSMKFESPNNDEFNRFYFEDFSFPNLPNDCPLKNGSLDIRNNQIIFHFSEELGVEIYEMAIASIDDKVTAKHTSLESSAEPYFVPMGTGYGVLDIIAHLGDKKQICIKGNYTMPRELGEKSTWFLKIDYFNWD